MQIVLTGGSSGIGAAILRALVDSGSSVGVVSRRDPAEWADPPPTTWDKADWIKADLKDAASQKAVDMWIRRQCGRVDALVMSAVDYGFPRREFTKTNESEWSRTINVNVISQMRLVHGLLPLLLKRPASLIVSLSSNVVTSGGPFRVPYATSKAAAWNFMTSLSREIQGGRVSVVQIIPIDPVATPGIRKRRPSGYDFSSYTLPQTIASQIVPLVNTLGRGQHGQVLLVGAMGTHAIRMNTKAEVPFWNSSLPSSFLPKCSGSR